MAYETLISSNDTLLDMEIWKFKNIKYALSLFLSLSLYMYSNFDDFHYTL